MQYLQNMFEKLQEKHAIKKPYQLIVRLSTCKSYFYVTLKIN